MKIVKKALKILASMAVVAVTSFISGFAHQRGSHIGKQVNELGPQEWADKQGRWLNRGMIRAMERYVGLLRDKGSKGQGKSEGTRDDYIGSM